MPKVFVAVMEISKGYTDKEMIISLDSFPAYPELFVFSSAK